MTGPIANNPEVVTRQLGESPGFPNNPSLPLVIYRQVVRAREDAAVDLLQQRFATNDWVGAWVNGVFAFHHYHSNAHEVLGVAAGSAEIQFGGPGGPVLRVTAGDVAILPAGTAHKRVSASGAFRVVGAYPAGQSDYDTRRGSPGEMEQARANIAAVPLPSDDPVYGEAGPLLAHWRR